MFVDLKMNKIKLLCTLFTLCTTAHTSAIKSVKETTTHTNNQKDMKERSDELSTTITEIETNITRSKASYTGRFSNLLYTDGTKRYCTRSSF